jgi:hypothetical protein
MNQPIRTFRLAEEIGAGLWCDETGLFLGDAPLLERDPAQGWRARPLAELNAAAGEAYRLPVDFGAKLEGLRTVAGALNRGETALARIAALQLRLPDPPPLGKRAPSQDALVDLVLQLQAAGLLAKILWDESKHPRWPAGSPNSVGGEFAPAGEGGAPDAAAAAAPKKHRHQAAPQKGSPLATSLQRKLRSLFPSDKKLLDALQANLKDPSNQGVVWFDHRDEALKDMGAFFSADITRYDVRTDPYERGGWLFHDPVTGRCSMIDQRCRSLWQATAKSLFRFAEPRRSMRIALETQSACTSIRSSGTKPQAALTQRQTTRPIEHCRSHRPAIPAMLATSPSSAKRTASPCTRPSSAQTGRSPIGTVASGSKTMKTRCASWLRQGERFRWSIPTTSMSESAIMGWIRRLGFRFRLSSGRCRRPASLARLAALCLPLALSATPAQAKTGVGDAIHKSVIGRFTVFQPLARLGNDGVRVTYAASLGRSWSIELHPVAGDWASGEIVFYAPLHDGETLTSPNDRMTFVGWLSLGMSRGRYDSLVAKIDAAMAEPSSPPEQDAQSQPHELVVCTDGADYLSERRRHGHTTWLDLDSCYDADRGEDIARLVLDAFPQLHCWLFPHDDGVTCYPPPLPESDPSK